MRPLLFFLGLMLTGALTAQELSLFEVFTDGAVLQRDVNHPVWGWGKPNRKVTVTLDGVPLTTRADRQGQWRISLPSMEAGGPHSLTVTDGRSSHRLEDIYFGDVYLLSGQSNMEWRLAQSDLDGTRARAIADPLIRQVLVSKTSRPVPGNHLKLDAPWKPGTAEEMAGFSGVGAYFAHYLRQAGVEVPIGLLHSSWGGSRIEAWLPATALDPTDLASTTKREAERMAAAQTVDRFFQESFPGENPPTDDMGKELGYLAAETDLGTWATMEVPGLWEGNGYPDVDGVFYFRRNFSLTEEQASGPATLHLGPIDDGDETYVNGQAVGSTPNAYAEDRKYSIAAHQLRPGDNVLAVRVTDTGGGGGFHGAPDSLYLQAANGDRVPLAGNYHYRIGAFRRADGRANHTPTLLYNAMIAPLQDWPLTGVLWYQGESNAGPEDAPRYGAQMRSLVHSWRDQLGGRRDSLPFYWVQLANYQPAPQSPDEPGWAIIRAQQTSALDVPRTGQAIITDIGEADDIHPENKWEVGRRLSLHALRDIYGQEVQAASPRATALEVSDHHAIVRFTDVGSGLALRHRFADRYPLVGSLTVQDTSGKWHWAVGTLAPDENAVIVLHPPGSRIRKVRYAWFNNPDDANLFSRDGLPVTPFEIEEGKE
ncbi:sialate O-acetylesterase [Lewinella marina]|uniref:sialate O-acetylesterase n=1 Tax=Neolewinella marina TaxID=438751 RepID=UPI00117B5A68|nr:sialate O-acetylesterase [Neolewinella marina]NJB85166.1 sialate O-acetylesterase [Neolewinella marina]